MVPINSQSIMLNSLSVKLQMSQVNIVSESGLKPLEVWVAEDSPFYRLVVEEAIEEIEKVTDVPISLTVF